MEKKKKRFPGKTTGPGSSAGKSASENKGKAVFRPLGGATSLDLKRTAASLLADGVQWWKDELCLVFGKIFNCGD